jgi:hypothetical protein
MVQPEKQNRLPLSEEKIKSKLEEAVLLEDYEKGELFCHCCGKTLNKDNIGAVLKINEENVAVCTNNRCLSEEEQGIY